MAKKSPQIEANAIFTYMVNEFNNQHNRMNMLLGDGFKLVQFYFSIAGLLVGGLTFISKASDNSLSSNLLMVFPLCFILFLFGHTIYLALRDMIRDALTVDTAVFFIRAYFIEKGLLEPYILYYNADYKHSNLTTGHWKNHRDSLVFMTEFTAVFNAIIFVVGLVSFFLFLTLQISSWMLVVEVLFLLLLFLLAVWGVSMVYNKYLYKRYIEMAERDLDPVRQALWNKIQDDLVPAKK